MCEEKYGPGVATTPVTVHGKQMQTEGWKCLLGNRWSSLAICWRLTQFWQFAQSHFRHLSAQAG